MLGGLILNGCPLLRAEPGEVPQLHQHARVFGQQRFVFQQEIPIHGGERTGIGAD